MTRSLLFAVTSLFAAAWTLGAQAQTPPAAAGAPPPGYGQGAPPSADGPPPAMAPWPITIVTSVEVLRSERAGGLDVIRARGLVSSSGWGSPHLVPITRGEAVDGILDLIFQGVVPTSPAPLGPFMPFEALLPVDKGHPYKGVRVRSGTNAIVLKTLPGYAEIAAPKEDCAKCRGKFFVAKGAQPPAGAAADSVVREADLPWNLRVIKPTDGIPSYAFDPNRLTLVLSEDGRIVDAAWD
ncbi:MAG: hypothetical protein Q8K93_10610 [Reyranella sp.]|uniref:hypothetical protein n=1 Tax=Reyranella sp. TaxID=1929291 RepID=UPI00273008C7|nr:hypothetical protein [Reyranella sp.]MDP1962639.1 hypothetical protein [Reyranella sp.]MDP2374844.1 hypothetical protein [Reyranella sp.]